ncbi:MAG: hypothetical protein QOE90_2621 [Thermoplasmata archaeon]|nr:hypothetical protein [Thermoplasmata archaeon]
MLPEFPKKFAPVPFEEHLQRLHEEHTRAADAIAREREELAALFRVVGDADAGERGSFTVLRGRRNVLAKKIDVVDSAQKSLLLLATAGTLARAEALLPALAAAKARGVETRVLAPIEAAMLPALARFAEVARVRGRELHEDQSANVAILVADGARAFIAHFVPDDASLASGKDAGVLTDQEAMVAAIRAILDPLWERAPTYEARREEIEAGRLPSFTKTYASSQEAWSAFREALARGGRELRFLDSNPVSLPSADAHDVSAILRERGGKATALLNFDRVASVDAYDDLARATEGIEVRHFTPQLAARYWLLDEREGFFALAARPGESEIVVHTTDPSALRSLRASFDAAWALGTPLPLRRSELDLFPRLQPGDLGIGALFNLLGDAVVVADPDGRIVLWNPAAREIFGYDVREALAMDLQALLADEDRERALGWIEARRREHGPDRLAHARARRKDGAPLDVEIMARPLQGAGERPHLVAVLRDVTARRAAEEADRRSRERILRIYESMGEAFFALDREWRLIYMNPVAQRMRQSGRDAVGLSLWEAFPDLKGTSFDREYHRAMRDNVVVSVEEFYPRMGMWFEAKAYPSEEGLSVYYRDVTQRKRAEETLRETQARLERAFADAPVGVVIVGPELRFLSANRAFCRMVGRSEEEMRALTFEDVTHEDDLPASREAVARLMAGEERAEIEKRYRAADGQVVRARTTLSMVRRDPIEIVAHVQRLGAEVPLRLEDERSQAAWRGTSR